MLAYLIYNTTVVSLLQAIFPPFLFSLSRPLSLLLSSPPSLLLPFPFLSTSLSPSFPPSISFSLTPPPPPPPPPPSQSIKHSEPFAELMLPQPVPLCGDIKIEFYHNSWFGGKVSDNRIHTVYPYPPPPHRRRCFSCGSTRSSLTGMFSNIRHGSQPARSE